ncbi:hypothetical protein Bca4012_041955 [Brassica carinata]|uniref:(rape) hypothetical protein n=1 Tax=Brassica napus TaxID=3708 RepID=A0A816ITC8_BRANA|nr:unnamed protein product [Brassica napus]
MLLDHVKLLETHNQPSSDYCLLYISPYIFETVAQFGVVFLLFALGLGFSTAKEGETRKYKTSKLNFLHNSCFSQMYITSTSASIHEIRGSKLVRYKDFPTVQSKSLDIVVYSI